MRKSYQKVEQTKAKFLFYRTKLQRKPYMPNVATYRLLI